MPPLIGRNLVDPASDEGAHRPLVFFFCAVLALTLSVYWPGLTGGFLFDDYARLSALAYDRSSVDHSRLLHFVFTSTAGPSGRPIANASFLLADTGWPTDPWLFKLHNVLFHLLAGVSLTWLALEILKALNYRHPYSAAILAGAFWMLHPLWVSTVLYVVQRMTILAAVFTFTGLAIYVFGRRLLPTAPVFGATIAGSSVLVFTPLATLSKENGALLPLFALLLEKTVLTRIPSARGTRRFARLLTALLFVPLLAGLVSLFAHWDTLMRGYLARDFTLVERLLTEARVLFHYLANLAVPRMQTAGLFHDSFPISTGLLSPPTTLAALLAIVILIGVALWWRRRFPLLSAAVLFFFAGHLIESTIIPLELYFEHRNYLPSALLSLGVVTGLYRVSGRLRKALTATLLLAFASLTFFRASLWGDTDALSLVWAMQNPTSARSQQQAAIVFAAKRQYEHAYTYIHRGLAAHPLHPTLRVHALGYICLGWETLRRNYETSLLEDTATALRRGRITRVTISSLEALVRFRLKGRCPQMPLEDLRTLLDAVLANPSLAHAPTERQRVLYLKAKVLFAGGASDEAAAAARNAYFANPSQKGAAALAAFLVSHGRRRTALQIIADAKSRPIKERKPFFWKALFPDDEARQRRALATLEDALSKRRRPTPLSDAHD